MAEHIIQSGGDINSAPVKPGDVVLVEPGEYRGVGLSVPNVIYESIEPRGAKTGQWYFESGANTVQILGFVVTTGDQGGAFILNRANKNNRINNCEMYKCGSIGVDVTGGSDYNVIEHSLIHDCHYAFHTSSTGSPCVGNVFRHNHCYNHSDGINVSPMAQGTQILNNIIYDCTDDGIHLFDGGAAIVSGNIVYNCQGVALWVNGNGGIITEHNTVIGKSGAKWGTFIWIEKGNHTFRNNILYVDAADITMLSGGGKGDIDYNCWYNPQNPFTPVGPHGIALDPKFVDILNHDYRLQPDSPCIGAEYNGVNMGAIQNGGNGMENWEITGIDFEAIADVKEGTISGKVTIDGVGLAGVQINLDGGDTPIVTQTNADGYMFEGIAAGSYVITPTLAGYTFSPSSQIVTMPEVA